MLLNLKSHVRHGFTVGLLKTSIVALSIAGLTAGCALRYKEGKLCTSVKTADCEERSSEAP